VTASPPRPSSIALLAFLLAVLLAACAAPPATPTPRPSPSPTLPPSPMTRAVPASPSPAPSATPVPTAAAGPAPLTLWAAVPEERADALRSLLLDAAHVAGVDVVVSIKSADGLSADVRAATLAGLALPDVVWGSQDDLGILQRAGALRPAGDGLAAEEFLPAVVEGATLRGERWGTPAAAQGFLLLLSNRTLAETAPATSDELIARARRLDGGGNYGIVAGWAEARWFAAWLNGTGGAVLDDAGAPNLDTPETIAALNLLKELRVAGPPPPSSYEQGARLFRDGRAAFAIDGDWSLVGYRAYSETLELGIAPMPRVNATGRRAAGPLGGLYLMYGAGLEGERLETAYRLGRTLALPELQGRLARDLGVLPALDSALERPEVTNDPALAAAAATARDAPGIPPLDELRCAWDAIEAALPLAILDDLTLEEAAARMQEQAQACAGALKS
jgi:arabinogalactan oligomer / maltooligosaccharide transport system substrate-binding protein